MAAPDLATTGAHGGVAAASSGTASSDRLVIRNVSMDVRVKDLAAAISSLRAEVDKLGGSVSSLNVNADSAADNSAPEPSTSASQTAPISGPADADITLRVPADKLTEVELVTSSLGRVTSQSSDESDVTQKHIDLSARLASAQDEEKRLQVLLSKAGSISDVLAVEKELSRVQGDVESMQQQLAYLNDQVAMATVKVTLHQPGPLTPEWASGWGFVDAFTQGLQGAGDVLKFLIQTLITLSPVIVLGLLCIPVVRWFNKRRRERRIAEYEAYQRRQAEQAAAAAEESAGAPPSGSLG